MLLTPMVLRQTGAEYRFDDRLPGLPAPEQAFDGSRNSLNDAGHRDFILACSAETYLIAAGAKMRLAKAGTGATRMRYPISMPFASAHNM